MSAVVQHPRAVELGARRKLREKVERAVSRLIAVLDELDGDPDVEPSLGALETSVIVPQWPRGVVDDREEDAGDEAEVENEHGAEDDAGEPDHRDEPSAACDAVEWYP